MNAWLEGLSSRDRRVLLVGAVVALLLALYGLVWDPLSAKVEALRDSIAQQEQSLAWMQGAAAEVQRLRRSAAGSTRSAENISFLTLVDRTARQGKLGAAVKRVKPEGEDTVHIWFEQAAFDDLIPWLETLQRDHAVQIDNAVVDRQDTPGRVNARLVLKRAAG